MVIVKIFATIYLIIGLVYSLYVSFKRRDQWAWFPINLLFGPIVVAYISIRIVRGKKAIPKKYLNV